MDATEFFVFGLKTLPTDPANIKPGGLYFIQIDNSDLYELWFRNKSNTAWMQLGNVNKGEFLKTFNGLTGELILGASLNVDNDLEITITDSSLTETILVDLSGYATKDWVGLEGFLKASDLNGFATEQWVQNQNYLTQHQSLAGLEETANKRTTLENPDDTTYPTTLAVKNAIDNIPGGGGGGTYTEGEGISIDSSNVISAKFGTGATNVPRGNDSRINNGQTAFSWGDHANAGYATESWVQSQNYLTQHQSLAGYATESWVQSQSYLISSDLNGYATEQWVSSQGFSTQTLDNIEDTTEGVKVTGQVHANALIGKATNSNATGTYTIDLSNLSENYNLLLTGNTTINFSNMIAEDETAVITAVIEGDYSLSFVGLNLDSNSDIYNGTGKNLIVIHIEKGGASFEGTYTITNL